MTYAMNIREHEIAAQRLGNLEKTISAIRNGKGKATDALLMSVLGIDSDLFTEISEMLDNYPDRTDEEIAYELSSDDRNE